MIPLRDVIPSRTAPVVTIALVAANAVTFAFLHPLAVAANMLALWLFGGTVEDRMGRGRFLVFYLVCGATGAGSAAAAVAGVIGAYVVLYPASRIVTLIPVPYLLRIVEVPAGVFAAAWLLAQAVSGGSPVWPLASGVAAGVALVWVFRRPERLRVEWWNDLDHQRANFNRSRPSLK